MEVVPVCVLPVCLCVLLYFVIRMCGSGGDGGGGGG